ncbi:hypothetical protein EAX61_03155 [Dokdonia sinensis]|uniref:Outer membrane protein beta-barrel domain-containing protein n=1 Tax=Dokdonia sinensis TaxID=2479847 RepID=A0A3M0GP08_9FLAO|nr:hypothetical protein [Dokdonia sinensis]RMB63403.1 hypothetical protein EAX61_03155 [Dokdonia sinensis]
MKEKKNIDRLFQEKFKNFEAQPSDAVWEKIALAKAEKENRKVVPLWWRLGGIAAALALLIGLGSLLFNPTEGESTIVDTTTENAAKENEDKNFSNTEEQVAQEQSNEKEKNANTQQKNNFVTTDNIAGVNTDTKAQKSEQRNRTTSNNSSQNNSIVTSQYASKVNNDSPDQKNNTRTSGNLNSNTAVVFTDNTSINEENVLSNKSEDANNNRVTNPNITTPQKGETTTIAQNNSEEVKGDEGKSLIDVAQEIEENKLDEAITINVDTPNNKRWDVGAVAAPVYYGDFGGSGIDPKFKDNGKSGDVNLSYGVQVSYAVNKKFKVRTGVSNVDLSYGTNDISFTPDISATLLSGVDYNDNARFLSVTDRVNTTDELSSIEADNFQGGTSVSNGSLQQSVGYIEVPVEAVYTISDKRLGIEVIGGMSTLFLNDNEIAIESQEGLRTPIGESNSLNDVSFTTNVGVGVNYKVTDKVKVNVEPTLKYQLNAFEGAAADFKPYYIGLYTGVSYRF